MSCNQLLVMGLLFLRHASEESNSGAQIAHPDSLFAAPSLKVAGPNFPDLLIDKFSSKQKNITTALRPIFSVYQHLIHA